MLRCFARAAARLRFAVLTPALLLAAGCLNPNTTSRSTLQAEPIELQKARLQVHDPFPRSDLGPGESLRPRDYAEPRGQTRSLKERTYGASLNEQFGTNPALIP